MAKKRKQQTQTTTKEVRISEVELTVTLKAAGLKPESITRIVRNIDTADFSKEIASDSVGLVSEVAYEGLVGKQINQIRAKVVGDKELGTEAMNYLIQWKGDTVVLSPNYDAKFGPEDFLLLPATNDIVVIEEKRGKQIKAILAEREEQEAIAAAVVASHEQMELELRSEEEVAELVRLGQQKCINANCNLVTYNGVGTLCSTCNPTEEEVIEEVVIIEEEIPMQQFEVQFLLRGETGNTFTKAPKAPFVIECADIDGAIKHLDVLVTNLEQHPGDIGLIKGYDAARAPKLNDYVRINNADYLVTNKGLSFRNTNRTAAATATPVTPVHPVVKQEPELTELQATLHNMLKVVKDNKTRIQLVALASHIESKGYDVDAALFAKFAAAIGQHEMDKITARIDKLFAAANETLVADTSNKEENLVMTEKEELIAEMISRSVLQEVKDEGLTGDAEELANKWVESNPEKYEEIKTQANKDAELTHIIKMPGFEDFLAYMNRFKGITESMAKIAIQVHTTATGTDKLLTPETKSVAEALTKEFGTNYEKMAEFLRNQVKTFLGVNFKGVWKQSVVITADTIEVTGGAVGSTLALFGKGLIKTGEAFVKGGEKTKEFSSNTRDKMVESVGVSKDQENKLTATGSKIKAKAVKFKVVKK